MLSSTLFIAQQESAQPATGGELTVVEAVRGFFTRMDILARPGDLLDGLAQVPLILAGVFVVVGLLCVLNGYKWHRWVVVILAFLGGVILGNLFSLEAGKSAIVAVALGALCAIVATPLLKVAVAVFGGLTGAFIGANAWTALNSAQADSHWAGAAMGFIIMAMASFLLFRLVIVVFTSVGGAAMVIFGGITLLLQVDAWESAVRTSLADNQLIIPLLLAVAAVGGFVLQSSWHPEAIKKANGEK